MELSDLCGGTRPAAIDKILITSGDGFDGYEIMEYRGMVWGLSVRARDFGSDFFMGCKNFTGGELDSYTSLADEARQVAIDRMIEHARRMRANAIINLQIDQSLGYGGIGQVDACGTAVVIQPIVNYVPTGALGNILFELTKGQVGSANAPNPKPTAEQPPQPKIPFALANMRVRVNQIFAKCPYCQAEEEVTVIHGNMLFDLDRSAGNGQQQKCANCGKAYTMPPLKVD